MFSNRTGLPFRKVANLIILLSIVYSAKAAAAEAQVADNPKIEILVANQKVEKGTVIGVSMFDSILMADEEVGLGFLRKGDLNSLWGAFAARTILPNKPLHIDDISVEPVGPINMPDDYRKVTVLVSDDIKDDVNDLPLKRFVTASVLLHERSTGQVVVVAPVVKILAIEGKSNPASKAAGHNGREITLIAAKEDAVTIEQASAKGVIRVCGRCTPPKNAQEEQYRREEKAILEAMKKLNERGEGGNAKEEKYRREEKANVLGDEK